MSGCRLITGITGLLGQYLLCDFLRDREVVAVLVRNRQGSSAAERVDQMLAVWERRLGRLLQRPIVFSGDLRIEGLGLSKVSRDWLRRNVNSVVHNAASVRFQESSSGEPMISNVEGTRRILDFCRDSSVKEFHHVSTAFACGTADRTTPVYEKLHSVLGPFGNVYEQSKCLAEHLVRESEGNFSRTIYRPSVIVGESESGYAPSFNSIYTPLRLIWNLVHESPLLVRSQNDVLDPIGLRGDESRNIVPVDWVSAAMTSLIRKTSCHGGIYHITNPIATTGKDIMSAMTDALAAIELKDGSIGPNLGRSEQATFADFRQHMQAFQAYFASDPTFDQSRLREANVCALCPAVNKESLTRAFKFAIQARFQADRCSEIPAGSAEPRRTLRRFDVNQRNSIAGAESQDSNTLDRSNPCVPQHDNCVSPSASLVKLRLCLSGSGGGFWEIHIGSTGINCQPPEFCEDDIDENSERMQTQIYGSSAAFRDWLDAKFSFDYAQRIGAFVVTGSNVDIALLNRAILALRSGMLSIDAEKSDFLDFQKKQIPLKGLAVGAHSED